MATAGIRGFIASASLKLVYIQMTIPPGVAYPRLYRLGLIEAVNITLPRTWSHCPYPRLYRLGLIEAYWAVPKTGGHWGGYPRLYRLGLIEANLYSSAHRSRQSCIRGFIASASLKLLMCRSGRPCPGWYPRLYRLGLIEANNGEFLCFGVGRVSEALSPRPH